MAVNVVLKSVWDDSGIKNAQKAFDKIGQGVDRAFNVVATAAAGAGLAIASFAKSSINAASDLQESTNAVNVAFGDAAAGVLEIGKNSAESFGLAKNEFNAAAVRFSAFAERVVGAGGDVAGFIGDVTQRAADFASVFNIEVAEALRVFQSGLAGEAEPLKRFGINLLESEVKAYALRAGIISVGESMDETQKVQARYGLLLESTAKTQGDFANTSEGLANSQRILKARFTDLQAEIGNALLPAFTELFKTVADRVIPQFEKLGEFLNSPQGQKAIADLANTISDLTIKFIENFEGIVKTAEAVATFVIGLKLFRTAVQLATVAQTAFNIAVKANPYVLAATGLLAFVAAVSAFRTDADNARLSAQSQAYQTKILSSEIENLNTAYKNGAIDQETYETQLRAMEQQMNAAKISTDATAGELNRFNQLRLDGAIESINQFKLATSFAERQAKSFADSYSYLESIGAVTRKVQSAPATPSITPSASTGPSRTERQRELLGQVTEKIDGALKSYAKATARARSLYEDSLSQAEDRYAKSIADATTRRDDSLAQAALDHAANIASIQKDFADKQAAIIQDSIDRLRKAYRSAVETNVVDLFQTDQVGKSVDSLVTGLRDKLNASRTLLANSAQLASQGFSQTFIEQVVGAGTETGNELASAILEATPETQSELKELFRALEVESQSGMDALAQTMYEKTGLATEELKALYTQTNKDLVAALAQAQTDYADAQQAIRDSFDEAMADAVTARNEAFTKANEDLASALADASSALNETLAEIQDDFEKRIAEMGGAVKGLKAEIDALYSRLASPLNVSTPSITAPRVPTTSAVPTNSGSKGSTTINVNVKTDQTQSTAQVGAVIAKTINKYANTGGVVIGGTGSRYVV